MMAYVGDWGCYIHIPHTSGMWTKRVLNQLGQGGREGMTHSLPRVWAHKRYFTIIREPSDWLRSAFGNRRQSRWQDHPEDCPWRDFTRLVIPYRTKHFPDFIEAITTKEPGIVGWLFGCYTPPQVEVVRYGFDQREYLKMLGCDPEKQMPVNVSGKLPDVTDEIRRMVYTAEYETYAKYMWSQDGKCLYMSG